MSTTVQKQLETQDLTSTGEVLQDAHFTVQSPGQFRDNFSYLANLTVPGQQILLEVMQFEDTQDTRPIFNAMSQAQIRGVNTRFHYDRVALRHIRDEDGGQAYSYLGFNAIRFGDKEALNDASGNRRRLIKNLEDLGITDLAYKKRGEYPRGTHNHMKIAVAGDTAWFGTMNLRGVDFEMSNFMVKTDDPDTVEFLKDLFYKSETLAVADDQEHVISGNSKIIVDGGSKGESPIFNKAVEMAQSLEEGDEFVMIGQWPPVRMMYGELAEVWFEKMQEGVPGEFLLSPEEMLHPHKPLSRKLHNWVQKTEDSVPGMTATNLARPTHAKAFLIKRANGDHEVLFGSHNLTRWTVRNGTKELAMWSKDPDVVQQIEDFLDAVKAE